MASSSSSSLRDIGADQVELVLDGRFVLGEGSLWHPALRRLLHVDIEGRAVMLFDPETGRNDVFTVPSRVGTVVPVANGEGLDAERLAVCLEDGVHILSTASGALTKLGEDPEPDRPANRFNDGKCDPQGRLWAGTMAIDPPRGPVGAFYRITGDGQIRRELEGIRISNGLAWTADGRTLYYIDTGAGQMVWAFDFDGATGEISNRREAFRFPDHVGYPDGCTLDSEDRLWTAHFAGGRVTCTDPTTGTILATVLMPGGVTNVTSCAFGGDHLQDLYITTAREGLTAEQIASEQPTSGGLFRVRNVGATGVPANSFRV